MPPKLLKISTEEDQKRSSKMDAVPFSSTLDESEAFAILTPTSPSSPWRTKMFSPKLNAIRRHFALFDRSKLDQVNDEIETSWNCGICLETAVDPCVTRCGHMFCRTHLSNWLATRPSCPVCESPCTLTEDLVPFFERQQPSPLLTPSTEVLSEPSRSLTTSPSYDNTISASEVDTDDTTATAKANPSNGFKRVSGICVHYTSLALRILGLAIILAALLPGRLSLSSAKE